MKKSFSDKMHPWQLSIIVGILGVAVSIGLALLIRGLLTGLMIKI